MLDEKENDGGASGGDTSGGTFVVVGETPNPIPSAAKAAVGLATPDAPPLDVDTTARAAMWGPVAEAAAEMLTAMAVNFTLAKPARALNSPAQTAPILDAAAELDANQRKIFRESGGRVLAKHVKGDPDVTALSVAGLKIGAGILQAMRELKDLARELQQTTVNQ